MKNKRFIALLIIAVVLICGIVLFVSLRSEKPSSDSNITETNDEAPGVFYPIETQPLNIEELIPDALSLAWSEVVSEDDPLYLKQLEQLSKYTIDSITKDNDRYIIKATITAPNLGEKLMSIQYSELPATNDRADIDAYICSLLEGLPPVTTEAYAYAEWSGDKVSISFTDDFVDAMCGRVYSYAKNALNDYLEENQQ